MLLPKNDPNELVRRGRLDKLVKQMVKLDPTGAVPILMPKVAELDL